VLYCRRRYCPKEHALLWSAFIDSLLVSCQLITTTLSRDYDIQSLLQPLLSQLLARVQASTVQPAAPHSSPSHGTSTIFEHSDALAPAETVSELNVHYEPIYVDALLTLAEQLVAATRSGIALSFLQSVWQWVASLTAAKAHVQQGALQLKYDMAQKAAASAAANTLLLISRSRSRSSTRDSAGGQAVPAFDEHAGRALLQSLLRMCVFGQHAQHLHIATAPATFGTPGPAETCKVSSPPVSVTYSYFR
jgi:hypothetical protein